MFSQIHSDGPVYVSPKVEQLLLKSEGVLCVSLSSGNVGNNGVDNLVPGENWEGLL